jgi:hypothetical protein
MGLEDLYSLSARLTDVKKSLTAKVNKLTQQALAQAEKIKK